MTIPPGSSPMTPPNAAQRSAMPPPSTPPVYAAMPVAPPPTVAEAVASGETPVAMVLDVPGAQAALVVAYDLLKSSPKVALDGVKAKKGANGKYKVPLANGGKADVQIKVTMPGYPTIKVNGAVVYRAPKPPFMHMVAFLIATVGGLLGGVGLAGFIVGAVAGFAAGYGAAAWLRRPGPNTVRYLVLIGGGLVAAVVGVLLLAARFSQAV